VRRSVPPPWPPVACFSSLTIKPFPKSSTMPLTGRKRCSSIALWNRSGKFRSALDNWNCPNTTVRRQNAYGTSRHKAPGRPLAGSLACARSVRAVRSEHGASTADGWYWQHLTFNFQARLHTAELDLRLHPFAVSDELVLGKVESNRHSTQRMRTPPNQSCQPTPGDHLGFNPASAARRGCTLRSP
jgi:hypothetical protein